MTKISVYHVAPFEKQYFIDLNTEKFDLNLIEATLTPDTLKEAEGSVGILVDGSATVDASILDNIKNMGIKYVFTRFVGYNNINLDAAKNDGIMVANVPSYSPYSVAELALTMGMDLFRHVSQATYNTHTADFRVLPEYFSNEIHDATVGIIGVGHMGAAEAHLYHNLGASVLGHNRHVGNNPNVKYVSEDQLLKESDIVSLHVPYFPGENDNMISTKEINQMKDGAILVNTARGPLVDTKAVADGLESGKLGGFAADVIVDENKIDGKQFDDLDDVPNKALIELMKHYPNAIITPHMGFLTEPATKDMISVSYQNFADVIKNGKCKNQL